MNPVFRIWLVIMYPERAEVALSESTDPAGFYYTSSECGRAVLALLIRFNFVFHQHPHSALPYRASKLMYFVRYLEHKLRRNRCALLTFKASVNYNRCISTLSASAWKAQETGKVSYWLCIEWVFKQKLIELVNAINLIHFKLFLTTTPTWHKNLDIKNLRGAYLVQR